MHIPDYVELPLVGLKNTRGIERQIHITYKGLFMKDTTISAWLDLPNEGLLFDLEALYACLQTIPDHRDRRGLRYPLVSLLMVGVLAKLAGQDSSRGMGHWAQLRARELSQLFHLKRERMPHYSTWSRVLGHGNDPIRRNGGGAFAGSVSSTTRRGRGSDECREERSRNHLCPQLAQADRFARSGRQRGCHV